MLTYIHFPLRKTNMLSVHCINAPTVFRASLKGLRSYFPAGYRNLFKAKDNIQVPIQHSVDLLMDKPNILPLSTVHRGHVNYNVCLVPRWWSFRLYLSPDLSSITTNRLTFLGFSNQQQFSKSSITSTDPLCMRDEQVPIVGFNL